MINYVFNIEKLWWLMLCFLFIILIFFYKKQKYWCQNNKKLFIILNISIGIVICNFLPSWNDYLAKYYELLSDISLAYITGFIFYWLTCVEKSNEILDLYYFKSLEIFNYYLNIIAYSYYIDKYSKEKYNSPRDNMLDFRIEIPLDKYKDIIPISNIFIENEIKKMENKLSSDSVTLRTFLLGLKDHDISKECKETLEKEHIKMFEYRRDKEIKNLLFFFEEYNKFKNKADFYYAFIGMSEILQLEKIMMQIKNYEIKDNEILNLKYFDLVKKYENFLKNIPYIQKLIMSEMDRRIKYLSYYKKYIPKVKLNISCFNLNNLNGNLAAKIFLDFYGDLKSEKYLVIRIDENIIEKKIEKLEQIDNIYFLIINQEEKIKFEFVYDVMIDDNKIKLYSYNEIITS